MEAAILLLKNSARAWPATQAGGECRAENSFLRGRRTLPTSPPDGRRRTSKPVFPPKFFRTPRRFLEVVDQSVCKHCSPAPPSSRISKISRPNSRVDQLPECLSGELAAGAEVGPDDSDSVAGYFPRILIPRRGGDDRRRVDLHRRVHRHRQERRSGHSHAGDELFGVPPDVRRIRRRPRGGKKTRGDAVKGTGPVRARTGRSRRRGPPRRAPRAPSGTRRSSGRSSSRPPWPG